MVSVAINIVFCIKCGQDWRAGVMHDLDLDFASAFFTNSVGGYDIDRLVFRWSGRTKNSQCKICRRIFATIIDETPGSIRFMPNFNPEIKIRLKAVGRNGRVGLGA